MVKLYYRGMAEENSKPKVGRSARLLGIRPGIDIDVEQVPEGWLDEEGYLLPELERQSTSEIVMVVIRNTKGMSTSLSIESLPSFRKPPKFGGTGKDSLWQIEDSKICGDIEAIQDSSTHVSIMPRSTMLLDKYETALMNTQEDWEMV
ncbi:Tse2 family ADP-ribosyltransferase toxin [Brunnivagina elsteri]|uniref:Tse2 ADP-ribosyltransferase toxin domain-containing protein n=1 Tax=Brunnivagina elsteri CCALA 953 TaxID=987040 RepID=A0A2A2THQ3_9CYAN|nr:hypothetical protein [Calothrix elsteri]PAX53252.1 hypothetical protein CK510_14955 [Calothrix elsteri CCALA 953]